MANRLMLLWLVALGLGLGLVTGAIRQGHADRVERRAADTARAIAADWIDGFDPILEPDMALDAMPGLGDLLAPLRQAPTGFVGAAILLPSGQQIAAKGVIPALPGVALDALFGTATGASALRRGAQPVLLAAGGERWLGVPLRDWTGSTRGALVFGFPAPSGKAPGGILWRWPLLECLVTVIATASLGAMLRRPHWRRLSPGQLRLSLAGSLALVLLLAGLIGTVRLVRSDMDAATRTLLALGTRLEMPPTWWNARQQRLLSTSLETRLLRLAAAVPELAPLSIEKKPRPSRPAELPVAGEFRFDLAPGDGHRVVARLDEAQIRGRAVWLLVKSAMIALAASLALIECVALLVPAAVASRVRARHSGAVSIGSPLLFLFGCASAATWPALIRLETSLTPAPLSGVLLVGVCAACQVAGMVLGAHVASRVVERYGWRRAALPGTVCGLVGAGLLVLPLPWAWLVGIAAWGLIGFGGALGMVASIGLARSKGRHSAMGRNASGVAWTMLAGQVAGLAVGAAAYAMGVSGATQALGLAPWIGAAVVVATRRNDAAAALRYVVSRPEAPPPLLPMAARIRRGLAQSTTLLPWAAPLAIAQVLLARGLPALEMASRASPLTHFGFGAVTMLHIG